MLLSLSFLCLFGTSAGVVTKASDATPQWWRSEPASLTQLSDLELPAGSDLNQWAALEMAFALNFSSIDGVCEAQHRRHACVRTERRLHCLSGARFGEVRSGFMLHPQLTQACQKPHMCDLFKSRSTFELEHARAYRFWCSPRRVELDQQQRAVLTPRGDGNSYLVFDACGGLTNQRIALVQGFMIAYLTRSKAVLPSLNPNGVPGHLPASALSASKLGQLPPLVYAQSQPSDSTPIPGTISPAHPAHFGLLFATAALGAVPNFGAQEFSGRGRTIKRCATGWSPLTTTTIGPRWSKACYVWASGSPAGTRKKSSVAASGATPHVLSAHLVPPSARVSRRR